MRYCFQESKFCLAQFQVSLGRFSHLFFTYTNYRTKLEEKCFRDETWYHLTDLIPRLGATAQCLKSSLCMHWMEPVPVPAAPLTNQLPACVLGEQQRSKALRACNMWERQRGLLAHGFRSVQLWTLWPLGSESVDLRYFSSHI